MDKTLKISGNLTVQDWLNQKKLLKENPSGDSLWCGAFEFFEKRIITRYLKPIEAIENDSDIEGEGFAITAILCSLIEALETFRSGKAYRRASKGNPLNPQTEYFQSQDIFEEFLKKREPFRIHFAIGNRATSFYENVRCAVLHEAATRNGWRIRIDTATLVEERGSAIILNRILFVQAVKQYMGIYKAELLQSDQLKEALINKFDSICATS